jgi:hypothetical protein
MKKAISNISKTVIVVQLAILVGAFIFVYGFGPSLDYPRNNEILNQTDVNLKFHNANVILIDDNPDFTSAREIDLNKTNITNITFQPGTYYWKAVGIFESSPRKFVISSEVGLELKNSSLKNVGNVPLNVTQEEDGVSTGLAIVGIEVEYPVNMTNNTIYRGEQDGK